MNRELEACRDSGESRCSANSAHCARRHGAPRESALSGEHLAQIGVRQVCVHSDVLAFGARTADAERGLGRLRLRFCEDPLYLRKFVSM